MKRELPLRITVVHPPGGVTFCLQRGRDDLVPPAEAAEDHLAFDFEVRIGEKPDGSPNFLGGFAQGPPAGRFVYVNSGTYAGQVDSCWSRRAKVPLAGITWELIEQVLATRHALLEARIAGTGRDGGPACATVPLLAGGWRVALQTGTHREIA